MKEEASEQITYSDKWPEQTNDLMIKLMNEQIP